MVSNFSSKTDNRILWLVKILIGLCLITPLFVSSSLLFPYSAPKAFAFRIIVEIMTVFYLYLIFAASNFRPQKSALNLALLALFLVSILATILSVDKYLSFWGNLERMGGLFGLTHYFVFFFICANILRQEKDWQTVFKISVGVGLLVAFLAIMQRFFSLGLLMPKDTRPFATLGNAAYLAAYLIFNIFLSAYVFTFKDNKTWIKVISVFSFFTSLAALFLTQTRGAILGLLAGILAILFIYGLFSQSAKIKKYALSLLFIIIIFSSLAYFLRDSAIVKSIPGLNRLAEISFEERTVKSRLLIWQISWEGLLKRPALGWGPETYEIVFNRYYNPALFGYELWYDRAHNFIFDWGVTSGFLGLASYLSLFFFVFLYLRRLYLAGTVNLNFLAIFGGLFPAYLVQNLFVFDSQASLLLFFLVLAFVDYKYSYLKLQITERDEVGPLNFTRAKLSFGKKLALSAFVIFSIVLVYSFNIQSISASRQASSLINSLASQTFEKNKISEDFKKIFSYKTFVQPDASFQSISAFMETAGQLNIQPSVKKEIYDLSINQLKEIIVRSPNQLRYRQLLGMIYLVESQEQPAKIKLAIESFQASKKLAPQKQDIYFLLAQAYALAGQQAKAKEELDALIKIDPSLKSEVDEFLIRIK